MTATHLGRDLPLNEGNDLTYCSRNLITHLSLSCKYPKKMVIKINCWWLLLMTTPLQCPFVWLPTSSVVSSALHNIITVHQLLSVLQRYLAPLQRCIFEARNTGCACGGLCWLLSLELTFSARFFTRWGLSVFLRFENHSIQSVWMNRLKKMNSNCCLFKTIKTIIAKYYTMSFSSQGCSVTASFISLPGSDSVFDTFGPICNLWNE